MPLRRLLLVLAVAAAGVVATQARAGGPIAWCGAGEPTADQPDTVSAIAWHVVYAVPSDGVDRFAQYAPRLAGDAAAMSAWWLGQDPTRRPRFDLLDAPACGSEYGRVDVSFLRLPSADGAATSSQILAEVTAAGFDHGDKGYLVYVDGVPNAASESDVCGVGESRAGALAYAVVYLGACGASLGDDARQFVATHEVLHGLGAVADGAPHACEDGHVCDSPDDVMKAFYDPGDSLATAVLDVGRDDYYGHPGSWWDTRDSLLLYHLDATGPPPPPIGGLTVTSHGSNVEVQWSLPAADLAFLVYAPGRRVREVDLPGLAVQGRTGQTLEWTIRSLDATGRLGAPTTLRFRVGYGVVDAAGRLVRDTVAPAAVQGLRATVAGGRVVLRWRRVADVLGLRGYRVAPLGLAARFVHGTTVTLPLAAVRGRLVEVSAVDEAGNRSGPRSIRVHG